MQDVTQLIGNNPQPATATPASAAPAPVAPAAPAPVVPSAVPSVTDGLVEGGADITAEPATTGGMSPAFKVITVVLLILIAFVAGLYLGGNGIIKLPGSDSDADAVVETVSISSPVAGAQINGTVVVTGTASTSLGSLMVVLTSTPDSGSVELATQTVTLSGTEASSSWQAALQVTSSPTSELAQIKVYPANAGASSTLAQTVDVSFEVLEAEDRVKLYAPVTNQQLSGDTVLFAGQMQNFFEATMNIRLLDADGTELFSGIITASEDNYEQFAAFEAEIDISGINPTGATGKWVLYDVSAADGSETTLLEVPVLFASS